MLRKGCWFNPIRTSAEWRAEILNTTYRNKKVWFVDKGEISATLDVWQKMRERNLTVKIK